MINEQRTYQRRLSRLEKVLVTIGVVSAITYAVSGISHYDSRITDGAEAVMLADLLAIHKITERRRLKAYLIV